MKAEQIDQALREKFVTEGARLVFWHDAEGEFTDFIGEGLTGKIDDVQVLDLRQVGGLSAKLRLEHEDPTGKYLVYSMGQAPSAEEDWLLDIRLYSAEFHADVASLWLQELGLSRLSLRDHLRARVVFLGSQDRRRKLKRFIQPNDDEAALDLAMMAVVAGCSVASAFDVLRGICQEHCRGWDGRSMVPFDLAQTPAVLESLEKMGLLPRFWDLMRSQFDYVSDSPALAGLLRKLFVSELFHQIGDGQLGSLAHHRLPAAGQHNAVVYLTQWRDSSAAADSYDAAAGAIATEQHLAESLQTLPFVAIKNVFTFWEAERIVASALKERVLAESQSIDVGPIAQVIAERKAGHWLSGSGSDTDERVAMSEAYDAIAAAAELFALTRLHRNAFSFEKPEALLVAYRDELFQFDRAYRTFCTRAQEAASRGWDLLKALTDEVERVYDQGFQQRLGVEWSRLLDAGFLGTWAAAGFPPQQAFYSTFIRKHLAESDRRRAFVIISDAFRFEAATELAEQLNGKYRMEAGISAMLGVLPSVTSLGMASLLPHDSLGHNDKGEVLVDGKPIAGTEARNKHLAGVSGMACQAQDLRKMKVEEAREFTKGKRVVYIYHDVIDAIGDKSPTEVRTFSAVQGCIGELAELVQFCVNKLNAGKVWITADHGFLFQQEAPKEIDKSKLSHKPAYAVVAKKRYVLGKDLGASPEAHHGTTQVTAGAEGGMEFWIPRGSNRFHFAGGARFVHGGAMPQEVVVPVVTVTHVRGKDKESTKTETVSVQVLGTRHKITTPTYRFEFIQTEAAGERRKPLTARAAVYEDDQPVTSVEMVTFDSTSDSLDERKKSIQLTLRTGTFDKATPYRLILRDADTDVQVLSMPVVIDRSFTDDF